jgi:AcrR family transcriptional regulator
VAVERLSRAEKQAQTRSALVDAAQTIFLRRGFTGASVEEISAEAGFTRGAFYSNFESKEQLFVELLKDRMYSDPKRMAERRLADLDHLPSLRETGEELARLQVEREATWMFRLLLEVLAHAARHEEFRALPAQLWSENRELMAEAAGHGHDRAERRSEPSALRRSRRGPSRGVARALRGAVPARQRVGS